MKICTEHWQACRQAIDAVGLGGLVTQGGEALAANIAAELRGETPGKNFDPLYSMNMHWWGVALKCGGLQMMGQTPDGSNDGQFCPLCEMASHYPDFIVADQLATVAKDMAAWARTEQLIPPLS